MNVRRVLSILGLVLYVLAAAQLVPLLWCLFPFDPRAAQGFLVGAGTSATLATAFRLRGANQGGELYRRDGVLIVVGTWLFASVIGAIPYVASGAIPNPIDALLSFVRSPCLLASSPETGRGGFFCYMTPRQDV